MEVRGYNWHASRKRPNPHYGQARLQKPESLVTLLQISKKHGRKLEILVIESVYMVVQFILIAMRGSLQNVTLGTENPTGFITTAQVPGLVQER